MFTTKGSSTAQDVSIGLMMQLKIEPSEREAPKPLKKKMAVGNSRRRKKSRCKRTKSTDHSSRVVELRKERSRDAARNRRGKENAQFDELAKLLPLPSAITSQLDKASIVRLTISYLNMKQFGRRGTGKRYRQSSDCSLLSVSSASPMSDLDGEVHTASPHSLSPPSSISSPPAGPSTSTVAVVPYSQGQVTSYSDLAANSGIFLLQALDGFLFVLSGDAKVLYVSETVSVHLGLSQVELTGSSMYCYIHPEDQQDLGNILQAAKEELENGTSTQSASGGYTDDIPFFGAQQGFPDENSDSPNNERPKSFFLRMKCTLVRRGGSYTKSSGFKVIHCSGRMKAYSAGGLPGPKYAFVAIGQPLPTMNINELPLECNMFVSRVGMDLRIVYCEGRIHKFMDYFARDIVGISAYDFYHANDIAVIQGHHAKFLTKGQVLTKYYRWMNKNGGWVWMQTKASLIPHPTNPELKQMLCLNYIVSDVEHRGVVLGMAQLEDKPTPHPPAFITEVENDSDATGELKDAQYDDQVMVYPKWHETSDNLVPKPTLMDTLALNRTGYPKSNTGDVIGLDNEVFTTSSDPWGQTTPVSTWSTTDRCKELSRGTSIPGDGGSTSTLDEDVEDWAKMINAELSELDQDIVKYVATGSDIPQPTEASLEAFLNSECFDRLQTNGTMQTLVTPKIEEISMDTDDFPISSAAPVNTQGIFPAFENLPADDFAGDTKPNLIPMDPRGSLSGSKPRGNNSPCMFGNASSTGSFQQKEPVFGHVNAATPSSIFTMNVTPQIQSVSPARGPNTIKTTQSSNVRRVPQQPRNDLVSSGGGTFRVPADASRISNQNDGRMQFLQQLKEVAPQDLNFTDQMMVDLIDELMADRDERRDNKIAEIVQQEGFAQMDDIPVIKQEVVTPTLPEPPSSFPSFSDSTATHSSQPRVINSATSSFSSTDTFNQPPGSQSTFGGLPRTPQNGTVRNQGLPMRFQNGSSHTPFMSQEDNNMNFLNFITSTGVTSTQTGTSTQSNNLWNANAGFKQNARQPGLRPLLQSTSSTPTVQTTNLNPQLDAGMLSQQPDMSFLSQQNVSNMVPENGMRNAPTNNLVNPIDLQGLNSLIQSTTLPAQSYGNVNGVSMPIGNQHYPKFDMQRKL